MTISITTVKGIENVDSEDYESLLSSLLIQKYVFNGTEVEKREEKTHE